MRNKEIYSAAQLTAYIHEVGFLPLLDSGIPGFSAEEVVSDDCRYVVLPDGGWDWPLWKWKGPIVSDGGCVYGKFFNKKAGFISRDWWPDFCNYRRSKFPAPAEGTIDDTILTTLREHGSLITRELRAACGFEHGHEYVWGWSLLTTPEALFGSDASYCPRSPQDSYRRLLSHFRMILPEVSDKQLLRLIG